MSLSLMFEQKKMNKAEQTLEKPVSSCLRVPKLKFLCVSPSVGSFGKSDLY